MPSPAGAPKLPGLQKNQVLFYEETQAKGVYCLNIGKVKLFKTNSNGMEQIVHLASTGELLGFSTMINQEPPRMSAQAIEETSVCFIPKKDFFVALQNSPPLTFKLLKAASQLNGIIIENFINIAQRPLRERLALTLLMLQDIYRKDPVQAQQPPMILLSREDLSNIVGTATESLIWMLKEFKEEGIIQTEGRSITITDIAKLVSIGNIY